MACGGIGNNVAKIPHIITMDSQLIVIDCPSYNTKTDLTELTVRNELIIIILSFYSISTGHFFKFLPVHLYLAILMEEQLNNNATMTYLCANKFVLVDF